MLAFFFHPSEMLDAILAMTSIHDFARKNRLPVCCWWWNYAKNNFIFIMIADRPVYVVRVLVMLGCGNVVTVPWAAANFLFSARYSSCFYLCECGVHLCNGIDVKMVFFIVDRTLPLLFSMMYLFNVLPLLFMHGNGFCMADDCYGLAIWQDFSHIYTLEKWQHFYTSLFYAMFCNRVIVQVPRYQTSKASSGAFEQNVAKIRTNLFISNVAGLWLFRSQMCINSPA